MRILLFVLLFSLSFSASSQTRNVDENLIDIKQTRCLEKLDITNSEMCNCTIIAREAWDKVLNEYYQLLKTNLNVQAFEVLRESQKQWINYRDKEYLFISTLYNVVKTGTMWAVLAEEAKKDIVKERALQLKDHYETLGL